MKTTVFKNNRTQAVRIPKALAFPEGTKEVEIVKHGDGVLVRPKRPKMTWAEYFATAPTMPEDFMAERAADRVVAGVVGMPKRADRADQVWGV